MGTQKQIAQKIISRKADDVLAVKGNQERLEEDIALFFDDPIVNAQCACHEETTSGHGRRATHDPHYQCRLARRASSTMGGVEKHPFPHHAAYP